jgi:peptidoglycan/LPS O-acetylase OafA/YrhL
VTPATAELQAGTGHPQSLRESANLNLLRATAVLMVLACHIDGAYRLARPQLPAWPFDTELIGRAGVLLFFVHTSFVLMESLARSEKRGESLYLGFYVRRIFRIYPLSILCVLIVTLLRIPASPEASYGWLGWGALASNLALVQNLTGGRLASTPLWTLPYELQMYLVLPLIFVVLRKRWGLLVVVSIALLAWPCLRPIGRIANILQFAPCFISGVLAFRAGGRIRRARAEWMYLPLLLFATCGYVLVLDVLRVSVWTPRVWLFLTSALFCMAVGWILAICREITHEYLARPAAMIAKYSYGIYLSHMPIIWFAFVYLRAKPEPLQWTTLVALSAAVPVICFHAVELPMIERGRRIAARRT